MLWDVGAITDGGKPVDNTGELADGTKIHGQAELKAYLLARKDVVIRNLTRKLLGYALGRALTPGDDCVADNIAAQVKYHDYSAQTLIEAIVLSAPFRYQAPHPGPVRGQPEDKRSEKFDHTPDCTARHGGESRPCRGLEATICSFIRFKGCVQRFPKGRCDSAVLYMPNGVNVSKWTPEGNGRDFTLSPSPWSLCRRLQRSHLVVIEQSF